MLKYTRKGDDRYMDEHPNNDLEIPLDNRHIHCLSYVNYLTEFHP